MDLSPLILIMEIAPNPNGVASAAIVSSVNSIIIKNRFAKINNNSCINNPINYAFMSCNI
jgi:hypothetical protein